ncbi:MAG TPA: BlaI/MecI/CopY family transcriptional regulator [Kofleriaceae bacterium]|nr:BlaI/MecI/CopY family transcriptional regulator [Kofleriaceae bacterium]
MKCPELTPAELRVMKALWELGKGSVADVRGELDKRGNELAYTTVMTLLGRLATKNAVVVDKAREPFVYRPAFRRESMLRDRLRDFVREVFDGKADSLVLRLVEDESLSREDLIEIERKIADAEKPAAEKPEKPEKPKKERK